MRFHVKVSRDGSAELIATGQPPETLRHAKKASVRKWRTLEAWLEAHPDGPVPDDGSSTTCALCLLFYDEWYVRHCEQCPIAKGTGRLECEDTPYGDYRDAWFEGDVPLALKHARREAEFLESLAESPKEEDKR